MVYLPWARGLRKRDEHLPLPYTITFLHQVLTEVRLQLKTPPLESRIELHSTNITEQRSTPESSVWRYQQLATFELG